MLRGPGEVVWRQPVKGRHFGKEGGEVPVSQLQVVLAELAGLAQEVVVDIGQVLNIGHVVAEVLEIPMQDVEADVGEGVTKMARVVRGNAADIQAHGGIGQGLERNLPFGARVEEMKGHGPILGGLIRERRSAGER